MADSSGKSSPCPYGRKIASDKSAFRYVFLISPTTPALNGATACSWRSRFIYNLRPQIRDEFI